MSWIIYALATPFFFTCTNFIEKYLVEKKIKDSIVITILLGLSYAVLGFVILSFLSWPQVPLFQLLILLLSGILLVIYLIPYFKALEIDDASRVVPLFQVVPVIVLVLSYFLLHEMPTGKQLFAFVFIIVGGFILGSENISTSIFKIRKSFWFMMISSVLYGMIGVLFKLTLKEDNFWIILAYQLIGAGIGALLLLTFRSYRKSFIIECKKISPPTWSVLGINLACSTLANTAYAFAITLAPVALVTVVAGVQPLFLLIGGLALSYFVPKFITEDIRKSTIGIKLVSIAIIFIGLYFLNL